MTEANDGARIDVEIEGGTAFVTMANPGKRNAFTPESRRALTQLLLDLAPRPEIRAIVLHGEGEHFCAGADISRMPKTFDKVPVLHWRENMKDVHRLLKAITGSPKPIIAAVEGDAFGAGMSIAVACDIVIAGETARFGAAFTKIGLLPDMGLLYTLPQRVGLARAKQIMLLSSPTAAPRALEIGMVDELVAPGAALQAAKAAADRIAPLAPLAITMIKSAYARGIHSIEDATALEVDIVPFLQNTADYAEGVTAFREKRAANFTGS